MGYMELVGQPPPLNEKKERKKGPQDGSEVQKCLPDKPADRVQSLELMERWKERSESTTYPLAFTLMRWYMDPRT